MKETTGPNTIRYRDEDHTYWGRDNGRYLSASQIVHLVENKFDSKAIAAAYAQKAGKDTDFWVDQWEQNRDISLVRGNRIHKLKEDITSYRGTDVFNGRPFRVQNPQLFPETMPYIYWPDGIYTEQMLWNHQYRIAGRVDKFVLETVRGARYMHIEDYKSNKLIRFRSFCKDGKYKMLKHPVSHLMDCEGAKYTLQTSLYMFMGVQMGFRPGTITLTHFPHIPAMAPPGAKDPEPVRYSLQYAEKDVLLILEYLQHEQKKLLQQEATR